MLRFFDLGESDGKCLTAIVEGVPANVSINENNINNQLKRRQAGFGVISMELLKIFIVKIINRVKRINNIYDEITKMFMKKFPGDSIENIKNSYEFYTGRVARG